MNGIQDDTLLQEMVRDTIHRWRCGERPDAETLLSRHPELAENKSLAIDLIYEEYCLRHEQGDTLVPSTFCERFPHYEQSLSKMLAVHQTLEEGKPAKSPWPQVGDSFLGYELVEALGRGSLARVFLARETAVGRRLVVVKISRHGAGEAQLLGKAAHPSIVPILSVTHDESTGWTAICMPLLGTATGADLLQEAFVADHAPESAAVIAQVAARSRPNGVPPEQSAPGSPLPRLSTYFDGIARFGQLLAEGLAAAHDAGIMHRDIKPSNVLLAWSGRPMLLDFNLSTEVGPESQRVAGTLAYMAPELMEAMEFGRGRQAKPFDPRADVFSLGALLYQLLTNRLPAKPPNAEQLAPGDAGPWLAARREKIVLPRRIDSRIDGALESIVLRCLATNPEERYSSANELAAALRGYLGWGPRGWRQLRRRRREVLFATLGVAAIAIGSAVYISRLPTLEERLFARGQREFDAKQYAAAATTWGKCLEIRSDWPEAHFARGQALRKSGELGAARTEFLALKDTDVALAHSFAGYCDLALGNTVAAETDYQIAKQYQANDAVTWNNLGYCQKRSKDFAESIASFGKAIKADPNLAVAYCNRAVARFQLAVRAHEPVAPETLQDLDHALRLDPDQAEFHFHAGSIFAYAAQLAAESAGDPNQRDATNLNTDRAIEHLKRAYAAGYPRSSQKGLPQDFIQRLPPELQGPAPRATEISPAPLFASPPDTTDLGGFLSD